MVTGTVSLVLEEVGTRVNSKVFIAGHLVSGLRNGLHEMGDRKGLNV